MANKSFTKLKLANITAKKVKSAALDDITFPSSCLISIGIDCLNLKDNSNPIDAETLLRDTKNAIKKYDIHTTEIALTSILALLSTPNAIDRVKEHVVEIIKEVEDAKFQRP